MPTMNEPAFLALSDRVLAAIGAALDRAIDGDDADLDWSENDGVLTIDCGEGGRVIVNRHLPNREIWVAGRAGGHHFALEDGRWLDTRSKAELGAELSRILALQAGVGVAVEALPVA